MKAFNPDEAKEWLLRLALMGPVFTSLLQMWIGQDYTLIGFGHTEFIIGSSPKASLITDFYWQSYWPILCITAWFTISSVLFLRYFFSIKSFLRSLGQLVPPNPEMIKVIDSYTDSNGAKEIGFLVTKKVVSPFVLNQHTIVIPQLAFQKLSAGEIRGMIAHELAHVRRKDWIWLRAYNVFHLLFFFQPLNNLIKKRLIKIAETICDTKAVQTTGDKKSLATSILEVASWKATKPPLITLGLAFRPSVIQERIDSIIDFKKVNTCFSRWTAAWVFVALFCLSLLTVPLFSLKNVPTVTVSNKLDIYSNMDGGVLSTPDAVEKEYAVPDKLEIGLELENEIELNP